MSVKRSELVRHFEQHGFTLLREGANHSIYSNGVKTIPIKRHLRASRSGPQILTRADGAACSGVVDRGQRPSTSFRLEIEERQPRFSPRSYALGVRHRSGKTALQNFSLANSGKPAPRVSAGLRLDSTLRRAW